MTCDELKAAINSEIAQNARIAAIRSRMDAGTADFLDSELYTAITAEITAEQMRRNVLTLSDREPAFVDTVRERYTDTFSVFNAVQRILDAVTGIRIRTVQPDFENDRAHKIGHSLNDPTVPESVIERRAYSATENFVRSQHDRCTKANASFRSRAGLDCRITRTGGAKCCDWCASVSGSFTTGNAPDGIWGRHDNCKCSITYETRRGSFQQLSGFGMGWDTVEELPDIPLHFLNGETAGAGERVVLTEEQAKALQDEKKLKVFDFQSMPGKNDSAIADLDYINSDAFAQKFKGKYENQAVEEAVVAACRQIIKNRNGTSFEEAFFIDAHTGKTFSYVKGKKENGVDMPESLKSSLTSRRKSSIIMIHNHPNSSPLSSNDYATSSEYASLFEVIACGHNGDVYVFRNTFGTEGSIIKYPDGREECESVRDFRVAFTKNQVRLLQEDFEARHNAWLSTSKQRGFFYEKR